MRRAGVHEQEYREVSPAPDERKKDLVPPAPERLRVGPFIGLRKVRERAGPYPEAARVLSSADYRHVNLGGTVRVGAHEGGDVILGLHALRTPCGLRLYATPHRSPKSYCNCYHF